jgi:hypothetical protein
MVDDYFMQEFIALVLLVVILLDTGSEAVCSSEE